MRAYSVDLRERIVRAVRQRHQSAEAVAAQFEVSVWTVKRYLKRADEGRLPPSPIPGRPREIGAEQEDALRAQWRGAQDALLAEPCAAWAAAQGARVHPTTMARALARLGWSRKKRSSTPPNGTKQADDAGATR